MRRSATNTNKTYSTHVCVRAINHFRIGGDFNFAPLKQAKCANYHKFIDIVVNELNIVRLIYLRRWGVGIERARWREGE